MGIFYHPLDSALGTEAKVRILRILAQTRAPLSGREITSLGGIALLSGQRALRELVGLGLVAQEETRSQHLYTLNRNSELVQDAIEPLFAAEERRIGGVFEALRTVLPPGADGSPAVEGAYLFGSAARGADTLASDFDLLAAVGRKDDVETVHQALSDASPSFFSRFGLRLSPVVMEISTLRRMHADGDPFPAAVVDEGRRILGPHLEELLEW